MVFQRYQYGLHTELGQKGLLQARLGFAKQVINRFCAKINIPMVEWFQQKLGFGSTG